MTAGQNLVGELTDAADVLRTDDGAAFGPLAGSVSALLYRAAERLASQMLAWARIPGGPDAEAERVFAAELAVARFVNMRAGGA
jgi:hypothetical protein